MNRGVIFDMDGVLVDSYQPHFETWKQSAETRGLTMTNEQFAVTFGKVSREIIHQLWGDRTFTAQEMEEWDREKERLYRELIRKHLPAMDGADDLLAALHGAGFKLAIGSSGPRANVELVAEKLPSGKFFNAKVTGEDVKQGKPHPDVFLTAARKLELAPKSCVVVEDSPVGIAAGKAAGMAVIAITGTAPQEKLAAADTIVESLREITPAMVNQLLDQP